MTNPRKRGGVSMPCPKCGASTHVVQTRRNSILVPARFRAYDPEAIWRQRACSGKKSHQFWTVEYPADE